MGALEVIVGVDVVVVILVVKVGAEGAVVVTVVFIYLFKTLHHFILQKMKNKKHCISNK